MADVSPQPDTPGVPLVSVVVPTYNRRDVIAVALESVLSQDWPNLEIVVLDDGSTDGTAEHLCETYGERVRVVTQRNAGPSAARNAGFRASSGAFLTSLDSDDLMLPGSVRARAQALMAHPDFHIAYGRCLREKESGRLAEATIPPPEDAEAWPMGDVLLAYATRPFCHHTDLMLRRDVMPPEAQLYDPLTRNHEDYLMVLGLLTRARCVPCYRYTTRVRAIAGKRRQRHAHQAVLDQGLAPLERALRDPLLAERLQPVMGRVRARFLLGMASAARRLGKGRLYRESIRQALAARPGVSKGLKHLRRWLLSYLTLR